MYAHAHTHSFEENKTLSRLVLDPARLPWRLTVLAHTLPWERLRVEWAGPCVEEEEEEEEERGW